MQWSIGKTGKTGTRYRLNFIGTRFDSLSVWQGSYWRLMWQRGRFWRYQKTEEHFAELGIDETFIYGLHVRVLPVESLSQICGSADCPPPRSS